MYTLDDIHNLAYHQKHYPALNDDKERIRLFY